MYSMLIAATLLACGECSCGPGCQCFLDGPCRCVAATVADDGLPSIDEAVSIADRTRRPVVIWVGYRDADAEAAIPEAIHGSSRGITVRSGAGVCYATYSKTQEREWYWISGRGASAGSLRDALGIGGNASASLQSCGSAGGCSSGISAGGCAGGGCASGSCGVGGGRFGRRR